MVGVGTGGYLDCLAGSTQTCTWITTTGPSDFDAAFAPLGVPSLMYEDKNSSGYNMAVAREGATPVETKITSYNDLSHDLSPVAMTVGANGARYVIYYDQQASSALNFATDASGSWVTTPMSWPVVGESAPLTTPLSGPQYYSELGRTDPSP